MGSSYRQFCPVAKAMELLDERWTLLIVRELVAGSQHFNELRRGVPRMSPTLLSRRLHQLTRAGIVQRSTDGNAVQYVLTEAGRELQPVVEALGVWGIRWIGELGDEDLDPKLLLWDMHRNIDRDAVPAGRTVVQFRFSDVPVGARDWWLVITSDGADVCDVDPGYDVAVTVTAGLRDMVRVWRGDLAWSDAVRSGAIRLHGPAPLRRAIVDWFTLSAFAAVPRPVPVAVGASGGTVAASWSPERGAAVTGSSPTHPEPIDAEIVDDAPPPAPPAPDYDERGVPSFDFVRDRIEGRYATSLGSAELSEDTEQVRSIEHQEAERERAAKAKLDEIRRSMGR